MSNVVPMEKFTTCMDCKHFDGVLDADVWYTHFCKASALPTKRDPFDGVIRCYSTNDLGAEYFTTQQFEFCRNVNDGNCSKYKPTD